MEVQAGQDAAGPQRAGDASSAANCESFNAIPYFDRSPLSAITPRDVANFIGWLCDGETQGRRLAEERRARRVAEREAPLGSVELGPIKPLVLADATVRRILAPLRACLATTVHEGLIRHNPTVGAVLPHRATVGGGRRGRPRPHTGAARNVPAGAPPSFPPMFRFLAVTGLRWSELVGAALAGSSA
jgi:integrase